MAKEDILNKIRTSAANGEALTFDFATMPNDISVEEIALEVQKLTGKNVYPRLKELHAKKESVDFPFNELKPKTSATPPPALPAQEPQTLATPENAVSTSNAGSVQGTYDPFEIVQQQEEAPAPSLGARFKAGFMGREIEQPKGPDLGDVAQFAGENIGPTIGAAIGAASTAPTWLPTGMSSAYAGGMAGAAAGRSAQNAIAQNLNAPADRKSDPGLLADPVLAALEYGLGEGLLNKVMGKQFMGKAIKKVAPHGRTETGAFAGPTSKPLNRAQETGAAWLEAGPGIDRDSARAVMRDPEILWRNPALQQVEKEYGAWMKGLGGREQRALQMFGDETPSFTKVKRALADIEQTMQHPAGHGTPQYIKGLLTMREQIARQMEIGKLGDPLQKSLRRYWTGKLAKLDKAIETVRPGYARVRKLYNEALINKEFNNALPITKKGEPSIMKAGGMGTAATAGASAIGSGAAPILGTLAIGGAAALSPAVNKAAILGLAGAKRLANVALTSKLPASTTAALLREALKQVQSPEEKEQVREYIIQQKGTQPPVAGERPIEEMLTELNSDPLGLYEMDVETDEEGGLF